MVGRLAKMIQRRLEVLVDNQMSSAEIGQLVERKARASLDDLIRSGVASPVYQRIVDGKADAPESSVALNGGTIEYVFQRLVEAATFCFSYCRSLSPRGTGNGPHYADMWLVVVDGQPWSSNLEDIPPDAQQVMIVNFAPYARRLEGLRRPNLQVTETARRATARRFPGLRIRRQFVNIPGGYSGAVEVPYLRRRPPRGPITYPAVIISTRSKSSRR